MQIQCAIKRAMVMKYKYRGFWFYVYQTGHETSAVYNWPLSFNPMPIKKPRFKEGHWCYEKYAYLQLDRWFAWQMQGT